MTVEQINTIGMCAMYLGLVATLGFALYLIKKTMPKK